MTATAAPADTTRRLRWIAFDSAVGTVIAVSSERGVVAVRIAPTIDESLSEIGRQWPDHRVEHDDSGLDGLAVALGRLAEGRAADSSITLDLGGTPFQRRVWDTLQRIPRGQTRTYAQIADMIGAPTSVRAAASACAANSVALVVPCHRVVRTDGGLGGYRWGVDVKRTLLALEAG